MAEHRSPQQSDPASGAPEAVPAAGPAFGAIDLANGAPAAPGMVLDELYVPPERPKHVLYIDCDGIPLDVAKALEAPGAGGCFKVINGKLQVTLRVPLTAEAAKFAGQLAVVLADERARRGAS